MKRSLWMLAIASAISSGGASVEARVVGDTTFDPALAAAPYFDSGQGKLAQELLSRRDHAGCARELLALVASQKKAASLESRFLLAYCQAKAGQSAEAAAGFDTIVDKLPLVPEYARLFSAQAYLAIGRYDDALARARAVDRTSSLAAEAELVIGSALDKSGHSDEAAASYARYVAAYPSSWRLGEIRGRLATALDAAGKADDAQKVWREVYLESPVSLGARALPKLDPAKPLSADELARRATVLFDAMKNKESELAWAAVLAAPDVTPQLVCRARYHVGQSVWKQRDRARSAPLFEEAAAACATAKDADLSAKSLYQAGRAHGSRAEKDKVAGEKAIALYARLMSESASHSYADDAALRRADVLDTLGRSDEGSAALAAIPDQFPTGDQRGEALFRLAFRAFEKGDARAAKPWLERELASLPREEGWWEAGRTLYWIARCNDALAAKDQAIVYYTRAVREYPLSYYALMAMNRLLEAAPADADALIKELAGTAFGTAAPIADRPLFHREAFQRALLLLRLGMGLEARRELGTAGLEAPRRGAPLPADRELGWVTSRLFEVAGDYAASHAYGRYVDLAYAKSWPTGELESQWRLSFPRAYADLVEENVKKTGQPAALELAIMREESAFDPNLESFANAVGLTQLTAPPAARYANGLPHDAQALRDPAINVAIGARELGALWSLFDGNAALAIAGYNAGEGAVKRWLRDPDNKDRALDELVERIPYDETRGYTKRVLGTYFTYAWLARTATDPKAAVPRVRFALPKSKKR